MSARTSGSGRAAPGFEGLPEPVKATDPAPPAPAPNAAWTQLSDALAQAAQACQPTTDDTMRRHEVLRRVEHAVRQSSALRDVKVLPYGSFVSGFYNAKSDLDLAITGYVRWEFLDDGSKRELCPRGMAPPELVELCKLDRRSKQMVLRKATNKLLDCGVTSRQSIEYVLHARVPIIKFRDSVHGIECDMSIGGDGQELKAHVFYLLTQINPCFGQLYSVVKLWAKAQGIHDGTAGMFNSHCLALLVVFYLQTRPQPALPPMYQLFYTERPPLSTPRLLQGQNTGPVAAQAAGIANQRALPAQQMYGSVSDPLSDLLHGFVTHTRRYIEQALLAPTDHVRLSCWYGELLRLSSHPIPPTEYVLMVEEPMNSEDNPARTFGKKGTDFPWNLHSVVDALSRTETVLDSYKQGAHTDTLAALLFLLGPHPFIEPPVSQALGTLGGPELTSYLATNLRRDRGNSGPVLQFLLSRHNVPAAEWIPDYALMGGLKFRERVFHDGKLNARKEKLIPSASTPTALPTLSPQPTAAHDATQTDTNTQDSGSDTTNGAPPPAGRSVSTPASTQPGASVMSGSEGVTGGGVTSVSDVSSLYAESEALDESRAAKAAGQLVGYPAALKVATELAVVQAARDAAKKRKDAERKARQQQEAAEAAKARANRPQPTWQPSAAPAAAAAAFAAATQAAASSAAPPQPRAPRTLHSAGAAATAANTQHTQSAGSTQSHTAAPAAGSEGGTAQGSALQAGANNSRAPRNKGQQAAAQQRTARAAANSRPVSAAATQQPLYQSGGDVPREPVTGSGGVSGTGVFMPQQGTPSGHVIDPGDRWVMPGAPAGGQQQPAVHNEGAATQQQQARPRNNRRGGAQQSQHTQSGSASDSQGGAHQPATGHNSNRAPIQLASGGGAAGAESAEGGGAHGAASNGGDGGRRKLNARRANRAKEGDGSAAGSGGGEAGQGGVTAPVSEVTRALQGMAV